MAFPIGVALGIGSSIFGGAKDKNPGRLAGNTKAYNEALQGKVSAALYLKGRSGRYGNIAANWPGDMGKGGVVGKWATQLAADDAYAKYQTLLARNVLGDAIADANAIVAQIGLPGGGAVADPLEVAQQAGGSSATTGINPWLVGGLLIGAVVLYNAQSKS